MIIARVLVAAALAVVAGCSSSGEAAPPPDEQPTTSQTETTRSAPDFCADWYGFTAGAGASWTFAVFDLHVEGETPAERQTVSTYVDGMVQFGTILLDEVPADISEQLRSVVLAAAEAQNALASGVPALEAVAPLESDPVTAARDAVVAYQGVPC